MTLCRNCGKETKSDYVIAEGYILCAECASKHIFKLEKELSDEMFRIKARLNELSNERNRLNQLDCDHEWEDTYYSTLTGSIYSCKYCNLTKCVKDGEAL